MKRFATIALVFAFMLGLNVNIVDAITFDIGIRTTESDLDLRDKKIYSFDSGTMVYIEPDYKDNMLCNS